MTGRPRQHMTAATPPASPASIAAAIAALLARHGLTRIYTAACSVIAVISVTTGLTAWTNGRLLWITRDGQREAWPATDTQAAAARLAARALTTGSRFIPAGNAGRDDSLLTATARPAARLHDAARSSHPVPLRAHGASAP